MPQEAPASGTPRQHVVDPVSLERSLCWKIAFTGEGGRENVFAWQSRKLLSRVGGRENVFAWRSKALSRSRNVHG